VNGINSCNRGNVGCDGFVSEMMAMMVVVVQGYTSILPQFWWRGCGPFTTNLTGGARAITVLIGES